MNAPSIHRVLPHMPTAVAWILALALGVQAALIARDLIPQPQSTPAPTVVETSRPQRGLPRNTQSMSLQAILNAHLFGEAAAGAAETAGTAVDAPQTQLSLILAGTIAVADPQKGIGLIGESANNAKVFAVGENVHGGVKLNAVYPDRVILDRNGQLETLYLPRKMAGNAPRAAAPPPPQPTPGAALANRVRQMINEDPGTIAEVMRPQPVFANGKQRGFRVYPGRNRDQFTRLGLVPGDLIMAINGTPLDDPARGMEIFRSMGSASQVSVTLERSGQSQNLVLDMTQLAAEAAELKQPDPNAENPGDKPPFNPDAQ